MKNYTFCQSDLILIDLQWKEIQVHVYATGHWECKSLFSWSVNLLKIQLIIWLFCLSFLPVYPNFQLPHVMCSIYCVTTSPEPHTYNLQWYKPEKKCSLSFSNWETWCAQGDKQGQHCGTGLALSPHSKLDSTPPSEWGLSVWSVHVLPISGFSLCTPGSKVRGV